ncbi:MAG: monofunctional biosynthetic peptidoglycan transglycosylase [Muribaculaceae bacterium]|jgi:monofunctional biosynthetic peptidoglycan transglycosylase|nr:monofunctional biosynthetic peptidoglycan transglycosylase [Muribaculaceae bacterium]MBQ1584926.1 monofunctional biosynthetic peptidoglycan transglycosylase [Muribaculaceae bacterium]MBR3727421.1 monofunctional biosynthetic peptidoglycan transglycosylase [Muribaculaceae bacterium]
MKTVSRWLRNILIFFFTSTILAVVILKYIPVYVTPLMLIRCVENVIKGDTPRISHRWIPLDRISHNLPQAVMASEDNLFLKHSGFDLEQIQKAQLEAQEGKRQRGASTISQQTARNVFLWQQRSWLRKGLEAYFTFLIEKIWGKERIMEVYLNSIEMGRGIYGADAVARINFNTTPDRLTRDQCAYIAVSLPNPLERDSAHPTAKMRRMHKTILKRMKQIDTFPKDACAE